MTKFWDDGIRNEKWYLPLISHFLLTPSPCISPGNFLEMLLLMFVLKVYSLGQSSCENSEQFKSYQKNFPNGEKGRFHPPFPPWNKKRRRKIHLKGQIFWLSNYSHLYIGNLTFHNICSGSSIDQKQTFSGKINGNCSVSGWLAIKVRTKVCDTMTLFTNSKPMRFYHF